MAEQFEALLTDFLRSEEREWSDRDSNSVSERTPLPGLDITSKVSEISTGLIEAYHLSMIFSLADGFSEDSIDSVEPALANNLRNLRDLDIGAFNEVTEFLARGATFSVLRTTFPDSRNVALKTRVFEPENDSRKSLLQKLEAILLEVRVLTHPPLRHHKNIAQLIQIAWQGDSENPSLKWPVLVVDYADKGTLQDLFENEPELDFTTKLKIFWDVTEGLHALHSCKIAHGDLKPLNVLVYSDLQGGFTAKLSDFGGALLDNPQVFQEPMGTPPWTAPEYGIERPREQLLLSDVYALGLLFWRIVLNGKDPFLHPIFDLPADSKKADEIKSKMKQSDEFINRVKCSLKDQCQFSIPEIDLVNAILDNTIQVLPTNRNLWKVISLLHIHFNGRSLGAIDALTTADSVSHSEPPEQEQTQEAELRLSLGGLDFSGASRVFSEHVLSALEHTAEFDTNSERRIEASSILWRMYLAPDDFGIEQNVDKGLLFLTRSAEAGYQEDQALVLRLHRAFGREVPHHLQLLQGQWLLEAAATGSLTAMEDLAQFGFEAELRDAKALLRGRYCGIGEEVFDFEEEAFHALQDSFSDIGRSYLAVELEAGRNQSQDLRGYFLRLSATYGSVDAVLYLVEQLGTDINDTNSFNDRALLLAARSGHKNVVLTLLRLGADPRLSDNGGDTPLHWLCSFDENDSDSVAEALVQHHADIDAQADEFPVTGRLEYAETEFVAGTPLHRAICRGKLQAVRTLLRLGARLDAPALHAIDGTPLALAALLHYPDILAECLSFYQSSGPRQKFVTPSGRSILIPAMEGGSLSRVTMGRLIRHGDQWKKRAVDTLALLCTPDMKSHFDDLPGHPGCTALLIAARCQPHVLEFLVHNGSAEHINRRSKRFDNNEELDLDPAMQRPPLHEAILYNKPLAALKLLELGADAMQSENDTLPTSALYQCALASLEDLVLAEELCKRGLGVDAGPPDYETPFMFAVRNGCYRLARFLRLRGANVNALCSRGYMWSSHTRHTLLLLLLRNNRAASLSGLSFLLDPDKRTAGAATVDVVVDPERNHTAFHAIAMLNGDSIDSDTATKALAQCERYFTPESEILDMKSFPHAHVAPDSPTSGTGEESVVGRGGNTALHYAAIYANFEAVDFLLNHGANADLVNEMGMTALDIAELSYADFESIFVPRDIPRSPRRQLEDARSRRVYINKRLANATMKGVNVALLKRFTL